MILCFGKCSVSEAVLGSPVQGQDDDSNSLFPGPGTFRSLPDGSGFTNRHSQLSMWIHAVGKTGTREQGGTPQMKIINPQFGDTQ